MDLMRYAAELGAAANAGRPLPPVEKWNPDYCGELDLVIRSDGVWIHEGTPIGRAPLVRLFSTVLKREDDKYFLVTPVEKLGITVEDAPFLAVLMDVDDAGEQQSLTFTTNVGDRVGADRDHRIVFRPVRNGQSDVERAPYIQVRAGLEAKIARSVYYDLVGLAVSRDDKLNTGAKEESAMGVWSGGVFHRF